MYYGITVSIFILLKFLYAGANNNQVYWLLKPLDIIVSFFLDSSSSYYEGIGFFHEKLNITIDKSCSGFNFLMLSFLLLYLSFLKFLKSHFQKIIGILLSLVLSYIFTLFVNTSRILTAIFIEKNTDLNYPWLHETEGVFIYVSFLIIFYLSINHIQQNILNRHEKLA